MRECTPPLCTHARARVRMQAQQHKQLIDVLPRSCDWRVVARAPSLTQKHTCTHCEAIMQKFAHSQYAMASPQPTQEQPPKVYLRNDVYRSAVPDASYTTPYGKAPITYKAGDTVVYSRQPATVPRQVYPSMDSLEAPYYVDESTLRSGTFSDLSNQSRGKHSKSSQRSHHRYHHHHHRGQRIEDPDGYWKVPHANSQEKLHTTLPGSYVTPGGRQLARTPKQHTAGVQVIDVNETVGEKPDQDASCTDLTQEAEEYMQSSQYLPSEDSEMTVSRPSLTIILRLL